MLESIGGFRNMPLNEKESREKTIKEILEKKALCMTRGHHTVYADEVTQGYYDAMNCVDCQAGFSEDTLNNEGFRYVTIQRTRFN